MIYLDHAAAEPIRPEVREYVRSYVDLFYNPSSDYEPANYNYQVIESVRKQIADMINCTPEEIYFTSGCSESNALGIDGYLKANEEAEAICTKIEHSSILENPNVNPFIEVDENGFVDEVSLGELAAKYDNENTLWIIQHANNVIGSIQDIEALRSIVSDGVLMVDAAQTFGKIPIDVELLGIDILTASAGKIGSIRGTGFIYIRKGVEVSPIIYGTQESKLRGGTYFDLGIGAFGAALDAISLTESTSVHLKRNFLIQELLTLKGVHLIGTRDYRLPNNVFIKIDNLDITSTQLVGMLDASGFLVSADSACHAGSPVFSHVLDAIGETPETAKTCIRITLGPENTVQELNDFVAALKGIIRMWGS